MTADAVDTEGMFVKWACKLALAEARAHSTNHLAFLAQVAADCAVCSGASIALCCMHATIMTSDTKAP